MAWGAQRKGVNDLIARMDDAAEGLQSLYVLSLRKIGPEEATALAEALGRNSTLTEMGISGHAIGPSGAAAFCEALKVNESLTKLQIGDTTFGDEGVAALAEALCVNRGLKELYLDNKGITEEGGRMLASAVKNNDTLVKLDVSRNELGDDGTAEISKSLEGHSALEEIVLSNCGFGAKSCTALGEVMKAPRFKVASVNLAGNPGMGESGAEQLALALGAKESNSLRNLVLDECDFGDMSVLRLAASLGGGVVLDTLSLSSNGITSAGASALAESLEKGAHIKKLVLTENFVEDAGATALAEGLKINSHVSSLDLGGNGLTSAGVVEFGRCIHLKELHLFNNNAGDAGAAALAEQLVDNTSEGSECKLEVLVLGVNGISNTGARRLCEVIERHLAEPESLKLRVLELFGNNDVTEECHNLLDECADKFRGRIDIAWCAPNQRNQEEGGQM